ncbi:uncharacterized protein [Dermacentor andersoni]|uniref:uncharacterized protein isoform X1 n=1 Tax=Dermacentor andersoni TaxID=34620 RepID=UPI002417A585|nr:uncharacterized protein LOC129386201 isoform X1 [Dermacentor andersoni]
MPGIPRPCSPRRKSRSASAEREKGPVLAQAAAKPQPAATTGPVLVYQVAKPARSESSSHDPVIVYQYPRVLDSPSKSPTRATSSRSSRSSRASPSPRTSPVRRAAVSPTEEQPEPQSCCIMDRIEKKYQESSSELDGQHLYIVLCFQSAIATLLFLLFLCVPVAMITVGALNLSNCRLSYAIPLCLTVAGCAYLLIPLLSAALDWNASNSYCPIMISVLVVVAMGASTTGSVFVFSGMWPSGKPDDPRYCHPAVYYFSFIMWSTFIVFIPVMLVVSVVVFRKYGRHNVHAATMPSPR